MEVENINLPVDKQDIDNIKGSEHYIHYLNYGVKNGYISDDVAEEIIKNEDWGEVEKMMDLADAYEPSVDDLSPEEFERFKNEELYGNEGVDIEEDI